MAETEVYRLAEPNYNARCLEPNKCFDTSKCYKTALRTRMEGPWHNQRYYTTNPLRYVGKYVSSIRTGSANGTEITEIFNDNGTENRVELDYDGKTSFIETPCRHESSTTTYSTNSPAATYGGKRRMKKTRKSRKGRKGTRGRKH